MRGPRLFEEKSEKKLSFPSSFLSIAVLSYLGSCFLLFVLYYGLVDGSFNSHMGRGRGNERCDAKEDHNRHLCLALAGRSCLSDNRCLWHGTSFCRTQIFGNMNYVAQFALIPLFFVRGLICLIYYYIESLVLTFVIVTVLISWILYKKIRVQEKRQNID